MSWALPSVPGWQGNCLPSVAQIKGLYSKVHRSVKDEYLSQNLVRPGTVPQSAADLQVSSLRPGWALHSEPKWGTTCTQWHETKECTGNLIQL